MRGSRKVRGLVMGNFIGSTIVSFMVFMFMIVMFGFDLEDEIFDYQVTLAANELARTKTHLEGANGTIHTLPMDYYVGMSDMPEWLVSEIDPAVSNRNIEIFAEEHGHFHVAIRTLENDQKIYLIFNARPYIKSTTQIKSYLAIIGVMAGVIFLVSLFFVCRMTRKVSDPLEEMAAILAKGEGVSPRLNLPPEAPAELHALADAIKDRDMRISALLERERAFNRDASHELRTPLAVAYGAAEVLEESIEPSSALSRLKTALKDMQLLTEGILWLGREPGRAAGCDVSLVCNDCISGYGHLVGKRDVKIQFDGEPDITMPVPEPVAHVMIGNILRNALSYTDKGEVSVVVREGSILVRDTGLGYGQVNMDREGFGVGLSLVKRLSKHFGINFSLKAQDQGGTEASLMWTPAVKDI